MPPPVDPPNRAKGSISPLRRYAACDSTSGSAPTSRRRVPPTRAKRPESRDPITPTVNTDDLGDTNNVPARRGCDGRCRLVLVGDIQYGTDSLLVMVRSGSCCLLMSRTFNQSLTTTVTRGLEPARPLPVKVAERYRLRVSGTSSNPLQNGLSKVLDVKQRSSESK